MVQVYQMVSAQVLSRLVLKHVIQGLALRHTHMHGALLIHLANAQHPVEVGRRLVK